MEETNRPFDRLLFLYSSATSAQNYKKKKKGTVNYPNISSAMPPVPHTEDFPVPVRPQQYILDSDDKPPENREKTPQLSTSTDADFTTDLQLNEFHRITQQELNDLIRDLDLTKSKAELLGSRLQKRNLLKENVRISVYRKRHEDLVQFFKMERVLVACPNIDGLIQTFNINHNPMDWRLFIDSSKLILKAVLFHNGNTIPSIPVEHSVHNKESYEYMKILMEATNYDKFKWQICGDLKVIALLRGLQQGFTKYFLFICEWGSRARCFHYSRKDWPARKSLGPGIMNVENQPLVEQSKILLSSVHLKLGLITNYVKAMNHAYLREKFLRLSEAKLKEGIFIGPQIREFIKDEYFDRLIQGDETAAWDSFKFVVKGFLGNRRAQNYEDFVNNLL